MNSVNLIGRIANSISLKKTQSGKSVASFNLAINRDKENADFIPCVVWDKLADNLVIYCGKGNQIGISGRIQTRNYDDQNGKRHFITEVVVNRIEFLQAKKTEEKEGYIDTSSFSSPMDFEPDFNISEDDLPF